MSIAKNSVVSIDYTLTDDSGAVIDTSAGRQPLAYLQGGGNIIPGLERALEGKNEGDKVKVDVAPAEGYGQRDEGLVQSVSRSAFRNVANIEKGMQFNAQSPNGPTRTVTVVGVDNDNIQIDANHPLAGKTLHFDVTIVGVRRATAEELQHGHAHGAGGHHH